MAAAESLQKSVCHRPTPCLLHAGGRVLGVGKQVVVLGFCWWYYQHPALPPTVSCYASPTKYHILTSLVVFSILSGQYQSPTKGDKIALKVKKIYFNKYFKASLYIQIHIEEIL